MARSPDRNAEQPPSLRLLLACGAVGPLLFIAAFLVEGAFRPDYSAYHNVVSSLSAGDQGWQQIANFIICGALVTGFAFGLRRVLRPGKGSTWGPILLGIFGVSLIGAGVFVTDPLLGYPPGAPSAVTLHGTFHNLFSLFAFVALIAACFVLARRFLGDPAWRAWGFYSIVTGFVIIVFFIISSNLAQSTDPAAPAGLYQRVAIIVGWVWVAAVALRLLTAQPRASR